MIAPAATRVGELVGGKYKIVRLLAQGGMGVVYEAQHAVVKRRFAVKFLRRDLTDRRDILTRFHREAEAAGALESEQIAAAVDFGITDDGAPFIVMEYLVGESLTSLLEREGPLPVGRAADLVSQAARGIEVAHAAGIIHRDLKPQNLFVCRRQDGTDLLKVLDFGVAKLQAIDEMNAATRTGAVVGTVAYMSPEQARGDKVVDQRSDVYALGAILYELGSGRKPHPGESSNAILHHIATQPPVPLESVAPDLPAAFVAVVARALAADAAARPPSAGALVEALAPFSEREVWPEPPKTEGSGATPVGSERPSPVGEAGASAGVARRTHRRLPAILAGSAAVVAAVFLIVGVFRRGPAQTTGDAPAAKPPLASRDRPTPAPSAALTSSVAASDATPPPHPLAGAGGATAVRPVRRHGARPAPTSAASSALPAAPAIKATPPTAKPPVAPVTFDRQNPYE
jgi:serine/threonine-protein kinase